MFLCVSVCVYVCACLRMCILYAGKKKYVYQCRNFVKYSSNIADKFARLAHSFPATCILNSNTPLYHSKSKSDNSHIQWYHMYPQNFKLHQLTFEHQQKMQPMKIALLTKKKKKNPQRLHINSAYNHTEIPNLLIMNYPFLSLL